MQPRKSPRQERSAQTIDVILEAAARVLATQGAAGFTTNRVAERAGVSVGSLYQYFPNKESLLFALQEREVVATTGELASILEDESLPPRERLRRVVERFLQTELEEAAMRGALQSAGVETDRTAAVVEARRRMVQVVGRFLRAFAVEAAPAGIRGDEDFEAEAAITMVSSVAERITRQPLQAGDFARWADTLSATIADRFRIPGAGTGSGE